MRINQSETARESFHSLSVPDYLQPAEARVMALFTSPDVTLTRKQIRDALGDMELSSVCGRVNSLIEKNKLAKRGEVKAGTGKSNELVGLPVADQGSLLPAIAAAA